MVPAARARHREMLDQRRPDLRPALLQARHRMRSIATLTGARRLPLTAIQLLLVTLSELVVGVFSGKPREAWASLRAMVGLIPRLPGIIVRRREVRALRRVPDGEIAGLQLRGSARRVGLLAQSRHASIARRELDRTAMAPDRRFSTDVRLDLCDRRVPVRQPARAQRHPRVRSVPAAAGQSEGDARRTTAPAGGGTVSARRRPCRRAWR